MNKSTEHIAFLDHIRGAAVLLVFLFHAHVSTFYAVGGADLEWNATGWVRGYHAALAYLPLLPATLGWIGVAIFFVVSGFCIHLSHERTRGKSFKVFFVRRFFRIYPPYALAVLFFAFAIPLVKHHFPDNFNGQLISHLLLVHNLDQRYFFGINAAFWSVGVEVQLYLIYPLLLWIAARIGWTGALWFTAVIELALRTAQSFTDLYPGTFTLPDYIIGSPFIYWYSWAIGAALADAFLKGTPLPFRHTPFLLWAVLFIAAFMFKPTADFTFTLAALATVHLIAQLLAQPTLKIPTTGVTGLVLNHLSAAGLVSYSLYLLHQPMVNFFRDVLPGVLDKILHWQDIPLVAIFLLCLPFWFVIYGISVVYYKLVELPSIATGKALLKRQPTPQ